MDYRQSHIGKQGNTYDSDLNDNNMNMYMARREASILDQIIATYTQANTRMRYLDFACGSGRVLTQLAGLFNEAIAVDISSSMINTAREKTSAAGHNIAFTLQDITQNPLDLPPFDLITAFRFFGNAEDPLRRDALRALRPLIKSDGMLVINNHRNPKSLLARRSGNIEGMTLELTHLRDLLDDAGFRIVRQWPIGAWMLAYRWSRQQVWDTSLGRALDKTLTWQSLAGLSPDMVIMARPKKV